MFYKNGVLRNFSKFAGKHLVYNFIKKETLAQVFSCEFFEISKNTFLYRTPPVVASDISPKDKSHYHLRAEHDAWSAPAILKNSFFEKFRNI